MPPVKLWCRQQWTTTWLGTDGHLGHLTGHAEGTNWAVYAGTDSPTAMVYGPYDTTYGQGHHTAQFKLMVDNNSGSDVIATLDVVTGFGGNVLATRQIRRSDFSAANQWQTFTLQLDNPCFGLFEARVWWAGNASMKFAQLTITPLNVASSGVQWLVTDQLGKEGQACDLRFCLGGLREGGIRIRAAMARKARVEVVGGLYHVIACGNNPQEIFHGPYDYLKFFSLPEVKN